MPVQKCVGKNRTTYFIDFYAGGKRYREKVGSSKKAAEIKLGKRLKEIEDGTFNGTGPRRPVPFEDLCDDFEKLEKVKKSYGNVKFLIKNLREFFKGRMVQEIGVRDVEQFRATMAERPTKRGGKRGNADLNHHLKTLRGVLKKAVEWEMIERNPASKLKYAPKPPGEKPFPHRGRSRSPP